MIADIEVRPMNVWLWEQELAALFGDVCLFPKANIGRLGPWRPCAATHPGPPMRARRVSYSPARIANSRDLTATITSTFRRTKSATSSAARSLRCSAE